MLRPIARTLRHWLTPHHTNNFRAKLLHNSGWFAVLGILLTFNVLVRLVDSSTYHILGFTSSISIDEVVRLTNQERIASGLAPLKYNETLSDAARRKAANMIEENYWAHVSPSGKSPWVWFGAAGYKYTHAGENLAKDFGTTDRMVSAWMASPTHKANIVSSKFHDIGVAVVPATILGQETVLVVQLFGSTNETGSVPRVAAKPPQVAEVQGVVSTPEPVVTPVPQDSENNTETPVSVMELKEFAAPATPAHPVLIDQNQLKKIMSLATTGLLLLVLVLDLLVAESRQLSRRVGKNWAHILYINVILILVTIVNAGQVL